MRRNRRSISPKNALLSVFALLTFFAWCEKTAQAQTGDDVELELLLAVDTSTSIDAVEYQLQSQGFARAFESNEVKAAIASLGPRGMAVAVVQWAGQGRQRKTIDWQFINSNSGAQTFASKLRDMKRQVMGFTDIAGALRFSTNEILTNAWKGARLTIDVSGDGTSDADDPAFYRDQALEQGITINGLVIFSEEHDLGALAKFDLRQHYTERVIGGPGHFLIEAEDFSDFEVAIRQKLVREITGPAFALQLQNKAP